MLNILDYDSMKNLSSVADSLEERVHTAFQELKDIEKNVRELNYLLFFLKIIFK